MDNERYGIQQNMFDQNRTTTTTTRTTRRFGQDGEGGQQQQQQRSGSTTQRDYTKTPDIPEIDEKLLQSKIHITRKYKGKKILCTLFRQRSSFFAY